MTLRAALACCAAVLATGCTQWVDGQALPAFGEPLGDRTGIVDVDRVLLSRAQMRAITGGGQDLNTIPTMDGKSPVDIEELARQVAPDCRFVFAETATFGPEIADFHKISYQYPPRGALISQGAASYRDAAAARRAFDALAAAVGACGDGADGSLLVGYWDGGTDSLRTRPGGCGRDYRLKSTVLVEVTFCRFPESVPDIVLTNILGRIPN